jgi:hypothetical protein
MSLIALLQIEERCLALHTRVAMFRMGHWWAEQDKPTERVALSIFLDGCLKRCQEQGVTYPKIVLKRLKQLQRGEWEPHDTRVRERGHTPRDGGWDFGGGMSPGHRARERGAGGLMSVGEILGGAADDPAWELRQINEEIRRMRSSSDYDDDDYRALESEKRCLERELRERKQRERAEIDAALATRGLVNRRPVQ